MIVATVTGNVGRDPELKASAGGKPMAFFSVASSIKREGRDNETTWVDVLAFDDQAERVAAEVKKGMRVIVTGRLSLETFEKRSGEQAVSLKMLADDVGISLKWASKQRVADAAMGNEGERLPW